MRCCIEHVAQQEEVASMLDQMKALEGKYQLEKKQLASIHDK